MRQEVGGTAMTLGRLQFRMAEGGVVSLFTHKKYASSHCEFLDNSGGLTVPYSMNKGRQPSEGPRG